MPLPLPQNVRFNSNGDVDFEVEISGAFRRATITKEAVGSLYAAREPYGRLLHTVRTSSHITHLVAQLLEAGADEPVEINSNMLTAAGLLNPGLAPEKS